MREPDQLTRLLVPERQPNATQAFAQREAADLAQEFVAVQALLKTVVRNAAVQVVDVVQAHVARKPLQHARQDVVGTAPERGAMEVPLLAAVPDRVLVLVLDVEQPAAD